MGSLGEKWNASEESGGDLEAMVAQLRAAGLRVTVDPETYPNGRFARVHDPEGNPIELWEPT